jgi:PPK2 family polyphosphate:nucleotide phosphotransferase
MKRATMPDPERELNQKARPRWTAAQGAARFGARRRGPGRAITWYNPAMVHHPSFAGTPRLTAPPGAPIHLADFDPEESGGIDKAAGQARTDVSTRRLTELQERLYAEGKRSLLIVLQAMDAGGKDGAIKHVMGPLNSQSCYVASFKKPTSRELAHDFLWRVHQQTPQKGEIAIFNRSHYEDVLVARVHGLVDGAAVVRRYAHINSFEELLGESGTRILKFYLHISKDEQKRRFADRISDPSKRWKIGPYDLAERKRWGDYMAAFEAALTATNTAQAPWHIVPSNKKWYRNLVIAEAVQRALEEMDPRYPTPEVDVTKLVLE